jgi:hypothetical protein
MTRHALILLAALGIVAAMAVPGLGAPPSTGAASRASLPAPNEAFTPGTVQFAGQDAGKAFNVAVVRGAKGAVLAYVCNGTSIGRWLTGRVVDGVAELTGKTGAALSVRFRNGRAVGTTKLGRKTIRFSLPRAEGFSGLRRAVARLGGRVFEAAWIVTNAGVTRGLATEDGGKTVATSSSTNSPEGPDSGVTASPGGSTNPDPAILNRFRCNRIVLAYSRLKLEQGSNPSEATQAEMDQLALRHRQLGCDAFIRL